ncbi:MAG: non-homologous end-joining DNA ligase [Clostridia bacterium]|nr:non-homologous end-joining DNA ligase [Clostridia bacterium]
MLENYNKKRNFSSTKEPRGKPSSKKSKSKMFVIQHHKARADHYDFRLEHQGVLLSWAVPKGLSTNPKTRRLAVEVEPHPVEYANFEGIIPKGNYGAGSVKIEDKGNYIALTSMKSALKKGHIKVLLNGQKYKGVWSLIKTDEKNWLIIKDKDEFVCNEDLAEKKQSNKLPFSKCSPMLATLSNSIPKGKDWLFEIKYDGYRIFAFKEKNKIKLISRNEKDYTATFYSIKDSLLKIKHDFIVDGELVSFDEKGRSDFGLLQNNIKSAKQGFVYVIFDLIALNGQDLRNTPLAQRKSLLQLLLEKCPKNLVFSNHVEGKGQQSFSFAKKMGLEGIVAKKKDSFYSESRSNDWIKIKCYKRQEFVIGGYTVSSANNLISSILVGYYKNDKFLFAGKVGTGFNATTKQNLRKKLDKIQTSKCPFYNSLSISNKSCVFVKPQVVAEIQYAEFTKTNVLRQPSYIGLREDKAAKDVVLEESHEDN